MGRIDDSLAAIEGIEDTTERAFQLAGLISTLFKLKGVMLVVTGQLAFDCYANSTTDKPTLDLASFSGKLTPRAMLEVMRGQLYGREKLSHWVVAEIPIRFQGDASIINRELCRDFMTDHGVVKLLPVEEITADRILASVYPEIDTEAQTQARLLLINGLTDAFHMDWGALHKICHQQDYLVGDELSKMRLAAKKDVDAIGASPDHVGQPIDPEPLPTETPVELEALTPVTKAPRTISATERAMNSIIDEM